jgi:hypothetical protein
LDIWNESAHARIRDYWLRANQAFKEKEEASGGRYYLDVDDEVFKYVNIDSMVAAK